jgi:hypothetical protein
VRQLLFAVIFIGTIQAKASVIPLDILSGLIPQVECKIQNLRGMCALDLGAEATFISGKAAKGLKPVGQKSMQTLGGTESYPVVQLIDLKLGGQSVAANFSVLVQSEIPTTTGEPLIGTIGADAFKNQTLIIDNAKILSPQVSLYIDPTPQQLKSFKAYGKMIPGIRPIIEIRIGNTTARALVDTHATSAVTGAFIKNNPALFKITGREQRTDIAGFKKLFTLAQPEAEICIQNQCTKNQWPYLVVAPQENIDIILGIDYIQQYTWLLSPRTATFSAIKKKK